jgi:hypothetical protein
MRIHYYRIRIDLPIVCVCVEKCVDFLGEHNSERYMEQIFHQFFKQITHEGCQYVLLQQAGSLCVMHWSSSYQSFRAL